MDCNNMYENNLILEKSVDKKNAVVGDILKYCITIINEYKTILEDVTIIDTLDSALTFVKGSVIVNGIPFTSDNVLEGVNIGCLKTGEIKVITFNAKIISRPESGSISNNAIAKFSYDMNSDSCLHVEDQTSNEVITKIDIAEIDISKTANISVASVGDIVTYTVNLTNIGTLDARNILLMDQIPNSVSLVKNSIEVNGNIINFDSNDISIYVGNLAPGESKVITYKVLVDSPVCNGLLVNKATVKFYYNLCNWSYGEKTSTCDEDSISEVAFGINTFKQISIDGNLCIPTVKPDMEEINDIKVSAKILKTHVITTPQIISNEGQSLSGYKLILRGVLNHIIEYTSDTPEQSVHSAHYNIPFSTFVILPKNYIVGSKVDAEAIVEDIYFKMLTPRCFFKNVTLLINIKIMSC